MAVMSWLSISQSPVTLGLKSLSAATGMMLLTGVLAGSPANASPVKSRTLICGRLTHIRVQDRRHTRYILRNDDWADIECLTNAHHWTNFAVSRSNAASYGAGSVAFPDLQYGCAYGVCSLNSSLPARVNTLGNIRTTWLSSDDAAGTWNQSYDIWFNTSGAITGQDNAAEVMIWPNQQGFARPRHAPVTWLSGARYYVLHWTACHLGTCWAYVQFRKVRSAANVHHLRLLPFLHLAERMGLLGGRDYLTSVEAGYEIWNHGDGLTTHRLWIGGMSGTPGLRPGPSWGGIW